MNLEAVPGIGAKTASALSSLEDPEQALASGDVLAIAEAPGISSGRAARIARDAIRHRHGETGRFLATDRAREIYESALDLLTERAVTGAATQQLRTLYPSTAPDRIEAVQRRSERAMRLDPDEAVLTALEGVGPPKESSPERVRHRCLATQDPETRDIARDLVPELSVELVSDRSQLSELARGYTRVVVLDEEFRGADLPESVSVDPNALDDIVTLVPERTLSFFARNSDRLTAAIAVHRHADIDPPCDLDRLTALLDAITADGTVKPDANLSRLRDAVDDLDTAVRTAEGAANDHLRDALEARAVTIDGTDLLSMVERDARVDSLLEQELAEEFETAIERAREILIDTLDLSDTASYAERIFRDSPTYPVEHDERGVNSLREELTSRRDRLADRQTRKIATDLEDLRGPATELLDQAIRLDADLAIARFARDFDCTMPTFTGSGIEIEGGRSPLLDVSIDDVEPITYHTTDVRLLSGVNSGGKTSLLDLVALIVTLSHMGLPVPAEDVRLQRFAEFHYHTGSQGTLEAGAFEATLRQFGDLIEHVGDGNEGLVLVDELESITEPGASAIIVAGILEALAERGATAIFVSHLAREIRETASADIPVDGIQARGLVDGELQVDRSPTQGVLARSTPELIVDKLAAESTESEFYNSLLEKF